MLHSPIPLGNGNLVENASFEQALSHWNFTNVTLANDRPFEGTAMAQLGSGTAKLSQDIQIGTEKQFFLFSFAVQSPLSFDPGNLTAEVHWLDKKNTVIGVGLSLRILSVTTGEQLFWLTVVDVTGAIPRGARKARIIFSKTGGADGPNDVLNIDKVLLTRSWREH